MTAGATAFRALEELEGAEMGSSMAASEHVKELLLQRAESEERYREVIARMKRLLEVERRNLRAVRAAHAKDLQSRTELESLLRACVGDVRKEIASQRAAAAAASPKGGSGGGGSALGGGSAFGHGEAEELSARERERVLELLLSQERVVSLLYERTFPPRPPADDAPAVVAVDPAPNSPSDAGGM